MILRSWWFAITGCGDGWAATGGELKSRPATANFSAILLASRADIDERLSPQDAADDYIAKPFFLKEATRRIKRTVDRIALEKMAKTAPSDGVVRGNLSQMNVID